MRQMSTITSNKVITILLVHTKYTVYCVLVLMNCASKQRHKIVVKIQKKQKQSRERHTHKKVDSKKSCTAVTNGKCFLLRSNAVINFILLTLNGFQDKHSV